MSRLNVPDAIAQHRAIQPAVDAYNALVAEQSQAHAALTEAKRALPQAREADKRAYATALAADPTSKDPGQKETDKAERTIAHAERRVGALNEAIGSADAAVHAAISTHHGDIMAALGERITNTQHVLTDALDAVETHLDAFALAKATASWLRNFPNGGKAPRVAYVPALTTRQRHTSQTPATTRDVVAGLRELLNPPERPAPNAVAGSMARHLGVKRSE
jgi:hypothetical protein